MLNTRRDYYLDHEHRVRWIILRKCASHTVRWVAGMLVEVQPDVAAERFDDYYTVMFVRHPWERIVSTMHVGEWMDSRPFAERMAQWVEGREPMEIDDHLRPQYIAAEGFRVDYLGRVERLDEHLDHLRTTRLPHLRPTPKPQNVGVSRPASWREVDYDWSRISALYEPDFELWGRA